MPKATSEKRYCNKCHITKKLDNFYKSNDLEKYPDGYLNTCKDCITMHVDNWNPDTFLWILKECDVPYVADEWNRLMLSYCKDPTTVKGTTIMGRYLGKMKLRQFNQFRWKDTQFLQDKSDHDKEEAMKRQGYDAQDIAKAIGTKAYSYEEVEIPEIMNEATVYEVRPEEEEEDYSTVSETAQPDNDSITDSLTEEDKIYLRMKWGKTYKPDEWVQLEKLYTDMMSSYDIQGAGHEDTLKLVCKTSLKSNQLLDMGDVEGAQKMVRMYDTLMKSGKFAASQNKGMNGDSIDSISEIVSICEKDGFIPRYYTDGPQDKVDRTLQDLQSYTRTLVTEEMGLGNLIENAIKQLQDDKEKEANRDAETADEDDALENELFNTEQPFIHDEEYVQLRQMVEDEAEDDESFLSSLVDEEELI